ncbi:hypothetical protein H1R20_g6258, partial [Candolleomyces eurysporus]
MDSQSCLPGCFGGLLARRTPRKRLRPEPSNRSASPTTTCCSTQEKKYPDKGVESYSPCCDFSYVVQDDEWLPSELPPSYSGEDLNVSSVAQTIENAVCSLNADLRELSMKIHDHPELMFEERYAHDLLTTFMSHQGFTVTKHYLGLATAWRAEFSFGGRGRVIGINSEMDALKGMGHGCGHNLIAVSGVGVAIALKLAMETHRIPGKVILIGTPAEEAGGGKVILLERGAYKEMDVCIMCHPSPGAPASASIGTTIAMQAIDIEYFGHSAHAAAALATSCRCEVTADRPYYDLQQNHVLGAASFMNFVYRSTGLIVLLGRAFADIVGTRYGIQTTEAGSTASTDFGNVSYALPALHPAFAIPTVPNGGNHTPAFARAAATQEAHDAMLLITQGLAMTAYRVLADAQFLLEFLGAESASLSLTLIMAFPAEIIHHILDELVSEHDVLGHIKTFHFLQSPPRVAGIAWLDPVQWTSNSPHWVFLEPLLAKVLQLLPHLEVLILELFERLGGGALWSHWPKAVRQSFENIIRGGRLKIVRFSLFIHFPTTVLHALVDNVPHLHVLHERIRYSRYAPTILPSRLSATAAGSNCTLDIPFAHGHEIPRWFLINGFEGHYSAHDLKHLVIRHAGNPLPDQEQQDDMFQFRRYLRNASTLERLSMLIENTEFARAYVSGCYRMFFDSSDDFLLGELASVRHVDLVLPLHFNIGRFNTVIPFPGPICAIFQDKTDGKRPSNLETVMVKITLTPMLLATAKVSSAILTEALAESDWTNFEKKLCSASTFPHLHTCVLDLSELTQIAPNKLYREELEALMRPKFSQLIARGVTFRLVL